MSHPWNLSSGPRPSPNQIKMFNPEDVTGASAQPQPSSNGDTGTAMQNNMIPNSNLGDSWDTNHSWGPDGQYPENSQNNWQQPIGGIPTSVYNHGHTYVDQQVSQNYDGANQIYSHEQYEGLPNHGNQQAWDPQYAHQYYGQHPVVSQPGIINSEIASSIQSNIHDSYNEQFMPDSQQAPISSQGGVTSTPEFQPIHGDDCGTVSSYFGNADTDTVTEAPAHMSNQITTGSDQSEMNSSVAADVASPDKPAFISSDSFGKLPQEPSPFDHLHENKPGPVALLANSSPKGQGSPGMQENVDFIVGSDPNSSNPSANQSPYIFRNSPLPAAPAMPTTETVHGPQQMTEGGDLVHPGAPSQPVLMEQQPPGAAAVSYQPPPTHTLDSSHGSSLQNSWNTGSLGGSTGLTENKALLQSGAMSDATQTSLASSHGHQSPLHLQSSPMPAYVSSPQQSQLGTGQNSLHGDYVRQRSASHASTASSDVGAASIDAAATSMVSQHLKTPEDAQPAQQHERSQREQTGHQMEIFANPISPREGGAFQPLQKVSSPQGEPKNVLQNQSLQDSLSVSTSESIPGSIPGVPSELSPNSQTSACSEENTGDYGSNMMHHPLRYPVLKQEMATFHDQVVPASPDVPSNISQPETPGISSPQSQQDAHHMHQGGNMRNPEQATRQDTLSPARVPAEPNIPVYQGQQVMEMKPGAFYPNQHSAGYNAAPSESQKIHPAQPSSEASYQTQAASNPRAPIMEIGPQQLQGQIAPNQNVPLSPTHQERPSSKLSESVHRQHAALKKVEAYKEVRSKSPATSLWAGNAQMSLPNQNVQLAPAVNQLQVGQPQNTENAGQHQHQIETRNPNVVPPQQTPMAQQSTTAGGPVPVATPQRHPSQSSSTSSQSQQQALPSPQQLSGQVQQVLPQLSSPDGQNQHQNQPNMQQEQANNNIDLSAMEKSASDSLGQHVLETLPSSSKQTPGMPPQGQTQPSQSQGFISQPEMRNSGELSANNPMLAHQVVSSQPQQIGSHQQSLVQHTSVAGQSFPQQMMSSSQGVLQPQQSAHIQGNPQIPENQSQTLNMQQQVPVGQGFTSVSSVPSQIPVSGQQFSQPNQVLGSGQQLNQINQVPVSGQQNMQQITPALHNTGNRQVLQHQPVNNQGSAPINQAPVSAQGFTQPSQTSITKNQGFIAPQPPNQHDQRDSYGRNSRPQSRQRIESQDQDRREPGSRPTSRQGYDRQMSGQSDQSQRSYRNDRSRDDRYRDDRDERYRDDRYRDDRYDRYRDDRYRDDRYRYGDPYYRDRSRYDQRSYDDPNYRPSSRGYQGEHPEMYDRPRSRQGIN